MATIKIDLNKKVKAMKPLHGGGQPPIGGKDMTEFFHYVTEAGIPFSRLHDVGGPFGGNRFVDIPNIFPDFDADENDPASYDFAFTDVLLEAMAKYDLKPIFRLGVTIENQAHIKAYRIHPPKDYGKWARICEHVIRHYNEGWADGFHYDMKYWEIWNEPENPGNAWGPCMWGGTKEEFFELYRITALHLRSCFADIKIGGFGSCGFFRKGFIYLRFGRFCFFRWF